MSEPTDPDLVDRVRMALSQRTPREVKMFGGISFMVDEWMVAAARSGGDLLLRVDPTEHAALLTLPGAHPAMMGSDREMGPNWLAVGPEGLVDDALDEWLARALAHHAATAPG